MMTNIEIPQKVPVMILSDVILFPNCMLPLHIFEKRYQEMLQFALESDRMIAISSLDQKQSTDLNKEVPHVIGTVGLIKMSKKEGDDLSNIVLQGIARVKLSPLSHEYSFPYMKAECVHSELGAVTEELLNEKENLLNVIKIISQSNPNIPPDILSFLEKVDDLESLVDLAAYAFIDERNAKQKILELTKVKDKYVMAKLQLLRQINRAQKENES